MTAWGGSGDSDRFTSFLVQLNLMGYRLTPAQIADAQLVYLDAQLSGTPPDRLAARLSFILAKRALQQQDFIRRFDAWRGSPRPPPRPIPDPPPPFVRKGRAWPMLSIVAAGAIALVLVALFVPWPHPGRSSKGPQPPPQPSTVTDVVTVETRELPPPEWWSYARVGVALAPIIGCAAWIGVRWRRRSLWHEIVAEHRDIERDDIEVPVPVAAAVTLAELQSAAQALRRARPSDEMLLDIGRSVDATARQGGFPVAVFSSRRRSAEHLVLIEEQGSNDHVSKLFDLEFERLRGEGVAFDKFFFNGDIRALKRDDAVRSSVPLSELASRAPDRTLIVIGSGRGLIDPLIGELDPGIDSALAPWAFRFFLSTVPPAGWSGTELALLEGGFRLGVASLSGLTVVADPEHIPGSLYDDFGRAGSAAH